MNAEQCLAVLNERINDITQSHIRNPKTRRTIDVNGKIFQDIIKECVRLDNPRTDIKLRQYIQQHQQHFNTLPPGAQKWIESFLQRSQPSPNSHRSTPQEESVRNEDISTEPVHHRRPSKRTFNTAEFEGDYIRDLARRNIISRDNQLYLLEKWMDINDVVESPKATSPGLQERIDNFIRVLGNVTALQVRQFATDNNLTNEEIRIILKEFVQFKPSSPNRKPRSPLNQDSPKDADYFESCRVAFGGIKNSTFKKLGNKLLNLCEKFSHQQKNCPQTSLKQHTDAFKIMYENMHQSHQQTVQMLPNIILNSELKSFLKEYYPLILRNVSFEDDITEHPKFLVGSFFPHGIQIRYTGSDAIGVGIGITTGFFQKLVNQLFDDIFVETTKGSKRYMINPICDITKLLSIKKRGSTDDHKHRMNIFFIAGEILAFCMVYGFKTNHHLSRTIQTHLLHPREEASNEEYILYYLLEFPEERPTFINLMRNPDHIDLAEMEFNDPIILDSKLEDGALITKKNFQRYLTLLAKNKFKIEESRPYFKALSEGFFLKSNYLKERGINLQVFDALATGSDLSNEDIESLCEIVRRNSNVISYGHIMDWFYDILRDDGSLFPVNVAQEEPDTRPQTVEEFKKQLLNFWTGSRAFNNEFNYKLTFYPNLTVVRAHTCFKMLDIPTSGDAVLSRDNFYSFFVRIVGHDGYGFAGGKY